MLTDRLFRGMCWVAVVAVVAIGGCASHTPGDLLADQQARGAQRFTAGDYAQAADQFRQAVASARLAGDYQAECDALIDLGSACEMLGEYGPGKAALESAADLAEGQLKDDARTARALNALGAAYTLRPEPLDVADAPVGPTTNPTTNPVAMNAAVQDCCRVDGARSRRPDKLLLAALALSQQEPQQEPQQDKTLRIDLSMRESQTIRMLRLDASIHDNLGNYYTDTRQFDLAIKQYNASANLGHQLNDPYLQAKGAANAGACGWAAARFRNDAAVLAAKGNEQRIRQTAPGLKDQTQSWAKDAAAHNAQAVAATETLPASSVKAFILNQVGQTDELLATLSEGQQDELIARATADYTQAMKAATETGDEISLSYALGYLGHRAEARGDISGAMDLTRKAVFAAQKGASPDSLYRWQWQMGRLLARQQNHEQAITFYQQAVETVKMIRNDIALGNGNQRNRLSFRDDVGQMYFELADLLLDKSKNKSANGADEKTLADARAAVETLKSAELEDYFRDTCVQVYKARNKSASVADTKVDGTAIVYVVPLKDRIELLVQVRDHLYERTSPHTEVELNKSVRELRLTLPYVADNEYLTPAKTLYGWLIDPIQSLLDDNKIDTLVFVPDGLLRTVPMAALYSGSAHQFLIEKYAIAVVPGLELMEPSEATAQPHESVLLSGLSQAQGDFPALSSVPIELTDVEQAYGTGRSKKLLNESFLQKNLFDEVRSNKYGIVHIASHGHFGGDASQTYILTYQADNPLTLNDLEKLIRPQQYDANGQAKPIDLLVLSCCETAAGDDRAALGLAGVAIKSGARSALATLWSVNDQGSAVLMRSFYQNFTGDSSGSQTITKAKALQRAQLTLLHNDNVSLRHPAFWSPYLIIGNWQ